METHLGGLGHNNVPEVLERDDDARGIPQEEFTYFPQENPREIRLAFGVRRIWAAGLHVLLLQVLELRKAFSNRLQRFDGPRVDVLDLSAETL